MKKTCSICHEEYDCDEDECDDPNICLECEVNSYRRKRAEQFW